MPLQALPHALAATNLYHPPTHSGTPLDTLYVAVGALVVLGLLAIPPARARRRADQRARDAGGAPPEGTGGA